MFSVSELTDEITEKLQEYVYKIAVGDLNAIAKAASAAKTTGSWRRGRAGRAGGAMAVAACGPLWFAVPASLATSAYLLRCLTWAALGTGLRMGAPVDPAADMMAILALWARTDKQRLSRAAKGAVRAAKQGFPYVMSVAALPKESIGVVKAGKLVQAVNTGLRSTQLLTNVAGRVVAESAGGEIAAETLAMQISEVTLRQIAKKLFKEVVTKRVCRGMVPVAGVVVNGTVSCALVAKFGRIAEVYYTQKLRDAE